MVEENSNINYELITKYLAGEANTDEKAQVTFWLNTSESNRHAFAQLKAIWEQTGRIIPHKAAAVNVEKGWASFQHKIKTENESPETSEKQATKARDLFYYFSRIAAVLIIGIGLYWIYQHHFYSSAENIALSSLNKVVTDTLSDGSVISLNVHSQLSYPEKFADKKRRVTLKGEAFFKVTRNPQRPFVVKVEGASITVLGTSFYVQAYDSLGFITVGVKEGKVKVATLGSEAILTAGERIRVDKSIKKIMPVEAYDPNRLYWKSKTLVFRNEKLSAVFQTLEAYYPVLITVQNPEILNCRLTAKFYGENIDRIFEIINTNFNLTSRNEDNHFIISGNGCD